jgi:GT2 family glycosyltransferase
MSTRPTADPAAGAPTSSPGTEPLVSVVVVNHNGGEDVEACIGGLLADNESPATEILVVDNASNDGSAEAVESLAERQPLVRLIRSPTNRGYAGAVNVALPEARGRYLAVLNMDIAVTPGWLRPLTELFEATPQCGAACPLILLESDPDRINAAGQNVHKTGLGFNRWLNKPRETAGTEPFAVTGLHGAAFVIRRGLLEELGGWDETGFLYHEDVQLSWLLRLAGAEIRCVPASTVGHDYHLSMFPEKLFLLERNRAWMLATNLHLPAKLALIPLLAVSELMMWGYCLLRGPSFIRAKLRSYRWIAANRALARQRRQFLDSVRSRSDWSVLRGLRWSYPLDQFLTLGRERGPSTRDRIGA